jgi:phosphonate transport system substrate-binding protein
MTFFVRCTPHFSGRCSTRSLPAARWAALLACLLSALAPAASADCLGNPHAPRVHRVDIVPQLPPSTLFSRWAPVLEAIGKATGLCLELRIAPTIPAFEQELLSGQPDFAFVNPYHLVMARRQYPYTPLIRDGKVPLSGVLVVTKDSGLNDLHQLEGKTIAFPAPNAFAASLLIRAELANKGIRFTPLYVKTHANVFRSVALGDAPAGGAVNNTLEREPENLRARLRVMYKTANYAPHPFIAHPRVPAALRDKVTQAFIQLATTEDGQKLLDGIQIPKPVRASYAQDYAPIERLQLDNFVVKSGD